MPIFWKVFIINRCWILSKAFSASIEIIILFLIFQFVNLLYHIDWFMYIEESLHSWNKPYLIVVYELFNVVEFCFIEFCWEFLHLCSSVIWACSFLVLSLHLFYFYWIQYKLKTHELYKILKLNWHFYNCTIQGSSDYYTPCFIHTI